jgi:glycine/D-amino acid oxidase-like deaminating enzyme
MAPIVDPVPSDTTLPQRAAVAVIGGGIVGVSTALELAERGVDVALFEKGEIGCEQSSRNWGWCRQMGRDPREIPLILKSIEAWRGMNARVGAETGFRQCGIVYLSATEEQFAAKTKWYKDNVKAYGLDTRLVSGADAELLVPGATRKWAGGLFTASDGRAEPRMAAPAIALAARRKGAKVFTRCAVRGVETKAGRVGGIVTEKGPVACDTVVLAGGAWSRRFLGNLDIPFPQLTVLNSVLRTEPLDVGIDRTASGADFTFRKRLDGGFTVTHNHLSVADIVPDSFSLFFEFLPILRQDWRGLRLRFGKRFIEEARLAHRWPLDQRSPFERVRVLDPAPIPSILDAAAKSLIEHFPAFKPMRVAERWAGIIDATPDAVPVISAIDRLPGLYLASGFSGHGFGLGPGAGRLMAEIVTGAYVCVDPTPFRYNRYFNGSNPRPKSGL